jgi:hypothetical protein
MAQSRRRPPGSRWRGVLTRARGISELPPGARARLVGRDAVRLERLAGHRLVRGELLAQLAIEAAMTQPRQKPAQPARKPIPQRHAFSHRLPMGGVCACRNARVEPVCVVVVCVVIGVCVLISEPQSRRRAPEPDSIGTTEPPHAVVERQPLARLDRPGDVRQPGRAKATQHGH